MNRNINKVAILGSGIMGSGIACHFANIGVEVLLLDLASQEEISNELKPESKGYRNIRNKLASDNLEKAIRANPSPLYLKELKYRIEIGNFEDDLHKINSCDWIIEVITERIDIKKALFEKIDHYRKPCTIISSNTSGIPIHLLSEGRSEDFKQHFCGTHFFNPPRYLKLLEIIPDTNTLPAIIDFLKDYGNRFLGKITVLAKDTPAFIANRIGVYSMVVAFNLKNKYNLSFEEIDKLSGVLIGRPKSTTFRTADLVQ